MMDGLRAAALGRVGRDAEWRSVMNNRQVLSFPLAVEDRRQREGDPTQWLQVTVWGEQARELVGKIRKGAPCYVEGVLRLRHWTAVGGKSGTSLDLTAWRCEPLFQFPAPPRPDTDDDPDRLSGFDENGDLRL